MNSTGNSGQGGILEPIWRLLDNVLAAGQNRLELFQVEAREEKIRVVHMLLLTSAITVLATLALALTIVAIVMMAWPDGLLMALAMVIAGCAIGAGLAWRALSKRLGDPAPFAASSEELRKDRQCIPRL